MNYVEFWTKYPILGKRLHTLHCESCKPMGESLKITYEGDEYNGSGTVHCKLQYGHKTFPVTVKNGVIYAFGRTQSMYRKTTMRLSNGKRSVYINDPILPKPQGGTVTKHERQQLKAALEYLGDPGKYDDAIEIIMQIAYEGKRSWKAALAGGVVNSIEEAIRLAQTEENN